VLGPGSSARRVGIPFLLLGIAALLGGVALLYRPELPQRLVASLTQPSQPDTRGGRRLARLA